VANGHRDKHQQLTNDIQQRIATKNTTDIEATTLHYTREDKAIAVASAARAMAHRESEMSEIKERNFNGTHVTRNLHSNVNARPVYRLNPNYATSQNNEQHDRR
jgi:hypothetical protein